MNTPPRRSTAADPLPGFHVVRSGPEREAVGTGCPPLVHRGSGKQPEIALTFDDGPSPWTRPIAAVFEQHGCNATFFARGEAVVELPEAVAALVEAGHEVGNHLWSHPEAPTLDGAELRAELTQTADAIEAAGAPRPVLVRPPFFRGPTQIAEAGRSMGLRAVVLRSIGSSDWEADAAERISEPVLAHARAGDIVCLHDGVPSPVRAAESRELTVAAVRRLVPALLERGLRPVTVSQLLRG